MAILALVTFSDSALCEDAGESTRTSAFELQVTPRAYDLTCTLIRQAALKNGLPYDFFAKLIWQESRFKIRALSAVGAQGIAQFMPGTASSRGLTDPFDPVEALQESASYLRELRISFGNLGLAAAAYNAGPGRLQRWLSGKSLLPQETIDYVQIVTGKRIEEWSSNISLNWTDEILPKEIPCPGRAQSLGEKPVLNIPNSLSNWKSWGVQLIGNWTQGEVLAGYEKLRRKHLNLLEDKYPLIIISYGPSGMSKRYLVRVAENTRQEAERLCVKLQREGVSCFTVLNPSEREVALKAQRYARLKMPARIYAPGERSIRRKGLSGIYDMQNVRRP